MRVNSFFIRGNSVNISQNTKLTPQSAQVITSVKAAEGLSDVPDFNCNAADHGLHSCISIGSFVTHTLASFHLPLVKSHRVKRPTEVSEKKTPQKTPDCSHPSGMARK